MAFAKTECSTMDWNDIRHFLAVARTGGLSPAASTLGLSPSTVSRRIETLEAALALPLFLRFADGYRLTDEGLAFLPRAEAMEAAALDITSKAAFCAAVSGVVRLAVAENLMTRILAPSMARFLAAHPKLTLHVLTGVRTLDLGRHEADLSLRLTRPDRGDLLVRRLGRMACGVYCARDARPDGFVGWSEAMTALPAAKALAALKMPVTVVADSLAVQHALAASGAVKAILPRFIGDADPCLVCDAPVPAAGQEIWLAIHRDVAGSARVRAVADLIAQVIAEAAEMLAGGEPGDAMP